jgi:GNAT superfamily N-acetyltransferase
VPDRPSVTLRAASLGDLAVIADFNQAMAAQTEGKSLPRERLEAGIAAVLRDAGKGWYLLAEDDGRVVGQLMVTFEWSDWRNAPFWWIQSVYVAPESRRRGIYSALHREVVARARAAGACGVRLYVERDNGPARATYEHLGMSHSHYDMYEVALDDA